MKTLLMAALLLAPGLAAAGDGQIALSTAAAAASRAGEVGQLDKDIHADKNAISADERALKRAGADEKAQLRELDAQEKTALAQVHADFQAKRLAVKISTEAQRKSARADIGADKKGMSNDSQERRDIQNSGK